MMDSFVVPAKTVVTAKGDSAAVEVSSASNPIFLLTLSITAVVEQGHLLGRPSRIQVTVSGQTVRVSGSGLVVAEGTLSV